MSGPLESLHECVMVRDARPEEFASIGALRVAAYRADGFLSDTSTYAATLRTLGADGTGEILAAVDDEAILGTVMLLSWPHGGEAVRAPGEAEVRALAVAKDARGRGIGRALLNAVSGPAPGMCASCCCSRSPICARPSTCTRRPASAACRNAITSPDPVPRYWPSA
jgi:GNAT superfamily N-acetyltransferase